MGNALRESARDSIFVSVIIVAWVLLLFVIPPAHDFRDSALHRVDDVIAEGFREEARFAYTCHLCSFTTRCVIAQSRGDAMPLQR